MERDKCLEANEEEKLLKLSPKYNSINKINECPGLAFVYKERKHRRYCNFEIILERTDMHHFYREK